MSDTGDLGETTAIVTGASAGIGAATARALAAEGASVVLAARREDRLQDLANELDDETPGTGRAVATDVTDRSAVDALVAMTVETFGGLDLLVNNAGTGPGRGMDVTEVPLEQYRTVMDVNVDGMFYTTRAALPHLRESRGIVVFVSSFAGCYPRPQAPIYAASKWWTRGFALSLAGHEGVNDVGVTLVNPTEVRTEFGKDFRDREELHLERHEPGAVTEPEEIAAGIVFAAKQEPPNVVTELDLYRRDKFADF